MPRHFVFCVIVSLLLPPPHSPFAESFPTTTPLRSLEFFPGYSAPRITDRQTDKQTNNNYLPPRMTRKSLMLMTLVVLSFVAISDGFRHRFVFMSSPSRDYSPSGAYKRNRDRSITSIPTSTTSHSGVTSVGIDDQETQRNYLKSQLFARCAACDRGYGANNNDRIVVSDLISELQSLSAEKTPTRGLYPNNNTIDSAPLEGVWQMVYTSAYDVLSLSASPLTIVQGIYQVICANGTVVNVIDLAPRTQALLPVQLQKTLGSTLRAKVLINGRARSDQRVTLMALTPTHSCIHSLTHLPSHSFTRCS